MSVVLPKTSVRATVTVTQKSVACGTLVGKDSDMNVQGKDLGRSSLA